ncbi:hypothetical protein RJ639_034166 [Escallonia herrerae]|uniref:Cycloartenol synthase n=1 Tax=Escallonia herrerae TaxID=1293975 RepID=A0AA88WUY4_9ASTE|nr:hypothetical protein RJ639_034166 [Escallonia herrerae]
MVCCWVEDPKSMANKLHLSRIKDYLWLAEDGMKMQGYNGSQLWDAAFAVQAILATNLTAEYGLMLEKANNFIKVSQVREDSSSNPSSWYRHRSKGGWNFSTLDQGWPVTDSTAEGFKVECKNAIPSKSELGTSRFVSDCARESNLKQKN